MQLEHEFTVPVPVDEAWAVLLDVERVAPCMPGATLESFTGDEFTGKVKVKVGPITVTYGGKGRFVDRDDSARTVTLEASGKEVRGQGTAKADVSCRLHDEGGNTRVTVQTELNVTGRPAQFGRGVMVEVGGKLIGRFASCLADELSGGKAGQAEAGTSPPAGVDQPGPTSSPAADEKPARAPASSGQATPPVGTSAVPDVGAGDHAAVGVGGASSRLREAEPIDLLETAGLPVLKRAAPVIAALALLAAFVWWLTHRG